MIDLQIDDIKLDTFKSTSKEQIDRLLRPGSTYFNLNPFDVLQLDPYAPLDDIKRRYKKMSIYVHPDKNPNDKERAQVAFEAVNRAYKMLEDDKERKKCLEVVDEAREQVAKTVRTCFNFDFIHQDGRCKMAFLFQVRRKKKKAATRGVRGASPR